MLAVLRSALFVLFLVVTIVPWALFVVLLSLFTRGNRIYRVCVGWLRTAIWGAKAICGVRWRVHGFEHLPSADKLSPLILVSKHQSTWETFFMPVLMTHPLAYVFKRELLYIPFFGWAIGRMDMIHINRGNRSEAWNKVAEQGKRLLSIGHWIIMFPEGTRTPRGSQGAYKSGASRLAVATGAALVPIAVTSARCWPRKSFVLRPGVIDVSIGERISSAGRDADDLMRQVETWIETEMRRLDPEAYVGGEIPSRPSRAS